MKKLELNTLNKLYALILLCLIIATGWKIYNYHGSSRYYYAASLTAPSTYPVYVQDAYFILNGGMISSITRIQVNETGNMRWGDTDIGLSANEPERLPVAIVIRYASYRDRKFYADSIPLPAALIESIFKTSAQKGIARKRDGLSNENTPSLSFLIGLANKGNLVLWLQGKDYERKLLTCHLKTIQPQGNQDYDNRSMPATTYFEHFYLDKQIKEAIMKGVDQNANYADSTTHYLADQHDDE